MYHDLPRSARFWPFLLAIDQDLAETTRKAGCPCGGSRYNMMLSSGGGSRNAEKKAFRRVLSDGDRQVAGV
jgi:hypothetical protein